MSNDVRLATSQSISSAINPPSSSAIDPILSPDEELSQATLSAAPANGLAMSLSKTSAVSVAVDPVALITTECITVTSAMRKHSRWAHSSVSSILGGAATPLSPGLGGSRPGTPRDGGVNRKGAKSRSSSGFVDGAAGTGFAVDDGGFANRWGLRGKKGKSLQDNPLMAGFGRLRRELVGCKGMDYFWDSPCLQGEEMLILWNRYTQVRYAFTITSFPPGHPSVCHFGPDHIPRSSSYYEILLL